MSSTDSIWRWHGDYAELPFGVGGIHEFLRREFSSRIPSIRPAVGLGRWRLPTPFGFLSKFGPRTDWPFARSNRGSPPEPKFLLGRRSSARVRRFSFRGFLGTHRPFLLSSPSTPSADSSKLKDLASPNRRPSSPCPPPASRP